MKLGTLLLGQKVIKHVVLVNRSPLDLSFTLLFNTTMLLDPKVGITHTMIISGLHTVIYSNIAYSPLHLQDLSFSPSSELNLKASGGSCNVEIQFSPRQLIPPFIAELQAKCAGLLHPLLTIHGCCQVGCKVNFTRQIIHIVINYGPGSGGTI